MIKVEGNAGLVRDPHSKAILSVDTTALQEHRKKKQMMKKVIDSTKDVDKLKVELDDVKKDISEIKSMLHQLLISGLNK